jgi:peptidoglycan-associated lipoprotein
MLRGSIVPFVIVLALSLGCCCPKKQVTKAPPAPRPVAQAPAVEKAPPPPPAEPVALPIIYFDFDKSNLKPPAVAKLDTVGDFMSKNADAKIRVEGHCDERGTNEYNLALGNRRADSAKKYLINLGVSADRLSTISYGEEKPADPGHDEAAWAKNRRDEFKLME